jgi:hypothetical protein
MRRRSLLLACALIPALVAAACGDDPSPGAAPAPDAAPDSAPPEDAPPEDAAVVPKGARVLGLAMRLDDVLFPENVVAARAVGARAVNVTLAWDEVERPTDAGAPDEDAGDASPTQLFNGSLHVANLVLEQDGMQALVALPALDAFGSRAPVELQARPLDDAELGARYDLLTDYVLRSFPDAPLTGLLVGTDVDLALGDDAAKHAAFATFVGRAAAHVHAVAPKVKVGFTVTSDGLEGKASRLAAAWAASDLIGVSVLPVDAAAHVRSPGEVAASFDRFVGAVPPGKPIVVHEAGFPTAAACGSDEAQQAAFVTALFAGWDRHADRIPVLALRELLDADADVVKARAARAGRADAPFVAFLGTLGLQGGDGRKKQGWGAFQREARARGF